jgi:hypothetical protein
MKNIIIVNKDIVTSTIFENLNTDKHDLEPIQCAFDLTKKCSPNCAACETLNGPIQESGPHVNHAICRRGAFTIGCISE